MTRKIEIDWAAYPLGIESDQVISERAAARLTLSDLCRARLGSTGEDDGALRAAYLAGYRAGVREAGARVEALGREAPGPEVVT